MNMQMIAKTDSVNKILSDRNALFRIRPDAVIKGGRLRDTLILSSDVFPDISMNVYPGSDYWNKDAMVIADDLEETFGAHVGLNCINEYAERGKILSEILPRVSSAENLPEYRKAGLAAVRQLDLVFTFFLPLDGVLPNRNAYIRVTESLLSTAGVTLDEAVTYAAKNIAESCKIESLNSVLCGMMGMEVPPVDPEAPSLFVVSNESRCYGAGVLLSKEKLHDIARMLGAKEQLVILPSSVHEILCLKDDEADASMLLSMVCSINETEVQQEDKLSDNVYFFRNGELEALI